MLPVLFTPYALGLIASEGDNGHPSWWEELRVWQTAAAAVSIVLVGLAAWQGWWPFDTHPKDLSSYNDPSIWQFLLSDRVALGFMKAGIAALVIYIAASIPALVAGGRWLRGFGTSGMTVDDAQDARKTIDELGSQLETTTARLNDAVESTDRLRSERNAFRQLVTELTRSQTQTQTRPGEFPMMRERRTGDEQGRTEENPGQAGPAEPGDAGD